MNVEKNDFFAEGKKEFYNKFSHKSILCQGHHWKKPPFVTILLTTYKRPELLEQALESALNQKGFDDYQIIVADNEGRPIEEETPTAKLLKKYKDEKKVIYYRHSEEAFAIFDAAVRLARSPWIVFLHDDDFLAEYHLTVMTDIVKKHKEIKFLGCELKDLRSVNDLERNNIISCVVQKYLKDAICLGDWAVWLGALISRRHFIAIGGMSASVTLCGDMVMVAKFHHSYGTYRALGRPLYYYRKGEQQESYLARKKWERAMIDEYYVYKYAINRYHKLTHKIWERNLGYHILELCEEYNKNYCSQINLNHVISECNMPADVQEKNILYYAITGLFNGYRKCVLGSNSFRRKILKKKIYIYV